MLSIYWCEDDAEQLAIYSNIIKNYLMMADVTANFVGGFTDPTSLIQTIKNDRPDGALFFLDIEYQNQSVNGIDLAEQLREQLPNAQFVFVSTHSELVYLTIQRRLEPLGFIFKDDGIEKLKKAVVGDIKYAYEKYMSILSSSNNVFEYQFGGQVNYVPFFDVYYIETMDQPHKVTLYYKDGSVIFNSSIKKIQNKYSKLFRSDSGFLVNLNNAIKLDSERRTISFPNGGEVNVSVRNLHKAKAILNSLGKF
ncbi:response regulator transcription factor [Pediococcus argentinicus]|nr:LytTR family transcriptional regulator DNA-binding domain-containing protein [Pediococcus argentinicus]NKZ21977.1 response regulator transcription factor [Pediococcus argentinicus]GEP19146.1 DNA-binding response regulator [Pediococcus argentinicus]